INLVVNTRAEDCIIRENFKSKLVYFSETDTLASWFKEHMSGDIGIYKSGGTVSILSYYFAKALGFKLIAFAGLDLAILNGKIYADGQEANITDSGYYIVPNEYIKKLVQVNSHNGQMLTTRDDYALFIRQFEEIFTREHNPARIINTSTNGALINGMEYMEFDELLSILADQNSVLEQELSSVVEKTQDKWQQSNGSIYQQLKNQHELIKKVDQMAKPVQVALEEICSLFEDQEAKADEIQAKIESIQDNLAQVRNDVISNVFLSTYLQGEVWKYTKQYNISAVPNLETIKANIQLELDFFTSVCWTTENIIKYMEESLPILESKIPALKS
ncbi:MAG TPA: hypothetical protein DDX14_05365, partial [Cyanobacteria bacterium UBA9579]|nr:hypothetical protein [Cyanobacteria bacterium UBA9579]